MCIKKIKNVINNWIKKEKNIKIREREEEKLKRITDVLLLVLIGGNFYSNIKGLYTAIVTSILMLIILILYLVIESSLINEYHYHTNNLIRKSRKYSN